MLIDSHCHIDVEAFSHDREAVISNAFANGVKKLIVPGIQSQSWDRLLRLCQQHDGLYPALGLHPVFHSHHKRSDLILLEQYIQIHQPLAVGEIGLDYYIDDVDSDKQIFFLQRQLEIAQRHNLPVILHVRKAHEQMLQILKSIPVKGGVSHAFNGSLQQAEQYIELGFKLGFGGMLTYERSSKLRKLASELPLDSIVLETDAPDMTVSSHRGQRNSPEYLPECLAALAGLRNLPLARVASITTQNCIDLFGFTE